MMSSSEPWLTLGRTFADSLRVVTDPGGETYVARDGDAVRVGASARRGIDFRVTSR
jgi:hypothetical protein